VKFGQPVLARTILIIIWCSVESGNVDARSTLLSESHHRSLWTLQITINLTEAALLIFLQFIVKKLLVWLGFEPTTLDFISKSGAFYPVTPLKC